MVKAKGRWSKVNSSESYDENPGPSQNQALLFPIKTFGRMLRDRGVAQAYKKNALIMLTAIMEYLTAEVLDLAVELSIKKEKTRISPEIIAEVIASDLELSILFKGRDIFWTDKKGVMQSRTIQSYRNNTMKKLMLTQKSTKVERGGDSQQMRFQ